MSPARNCHFELSSTLAYSPVSDRRRLTALVEVLWARKVQAPMPQISGSNLQKNHIIETCKEEGCAVSTQETAARRKWKWDIWHVYRPRGPTAVPIRESSANSREATSITSIFEIWNPSTARRGGCHSAMSRNSQHEGSPQQCGRHIANSPKI
jgi:hypothetical protein